MAIIKLSHFVALLRQKGDLDVDVDIELDIVSKLQTPVDPPEIFHVPSMAVDFRPYRIQIGDTLEYIQKHAGWQTLLEQWSDNLNMYADILNYYINRASEVPAQLRANLQDLANIAMAASELVETKLLEAKTVYESGAASHLQTLSQSSVDKLTALQVLANAKLQTITELASQSQVDIQDLSAQTLSAISTARTSAETFFSSSMSDLSVSYSAKLATINSTGTAKYDAIVSAATTGQQSLQTKLDSCLQQIPVGYHAIPAPTANLSGEVLTVLASGQYGLSTIPTYNFIGEI